MDAYTLLAVFMIFLICLGLHFATLELAPPVVTAQIIAPKRLPAVLRQNVAIARLMRMESP
jgi:hypothetical protein